MGLAPGGTFKDKGWEMIDEYDSVNTDDIALAAYLKLQGHTPTSVVYDLESNICHWEFNEFAVEDAADFLEDVARVNPRDYTRSFGAARRQMFKAKDVAERLT